RPISLETHESATRSSPAPQDPPPFTTAIAFALPHAPPHALSALSPAEKRRLAAAAPAVVGVDAGKFTHTLLIRPRGAKDSRPVSVAVTRAGFEEAVRLIRGAIPGAAPGEILVGIEFAGSY